MKMLNAGQSRKGQSVVEFVLMLPLLLIILAGLLDVGRLYYAYVAVTDAAAEGATYGAVYPPLAAASTCELAQPGDCPPDAPRDIDCLCVRAREATRGLVELEAGAISVACPGCIEPQPSGSTITVTVTYSFTLATPLVNTIVGGGVLPLRAVASEAVVAGALP